MALAVPQLPQFVWLLLPLGMIILVAVAYAVFEPEPEIAEEPLPDPSWRSQQPTLTPAPIALAGLMLQAATKLGKTARRGFAQVIARRRDRGRSFRAYSAGGAVETGLILTSLPAPAARRDRIT